MGRVPAEEEHEVAQEAQQHDPDHVQLEEVVEAEEATCDGACMLQVGWQPFGGEGEREQIERKREAEGGRERTRKGRLVGWKEGDEDMGTDTA